MAKQLSEQAKQRLKAANSGSVQQYYGLTYICGYLICYSSCERYKYVVQVMIGERREQGLRIGSRCFWDQGTDCQASETFLNVQ